MGKDELTLGISTIMLVIDRNYWLPKKEGDDEKNRAAHQSSQCTIFSAALSTFSLLQSHSISKAARCTLELFPP